MVGAGWFKNLKASEPADPSVPPKATGFRLDYTQTGIADPRNLAAFITKKVPDRNCWNCHIMPDSMKRGRTWDATKDVHNEKGLTCVYCHTSEGDHEIGKGDILVGSTRDDLDNSMKSCSDCHLKDADTRAPQPDHTFSEIHIEKIACETCHIPYKVNAATSVIDNAVTGHSIRYSTRDFLSNDPLNPAQLCDNAPKNAWCPAFVKCKGKLKPVDPMQVVWWGDWDRPSHRVIPVVLWRIRDFTGANVRNSFSITNYALLDALKGSKEVNTAEEIKSYLQAISDAKDRFGCRIIYHTPVLVKGGMIYYLEHGQLNKAVMPTHDGGFKCCEPFDLSHNIVDGEKALGSGGCQDCHRNPSPFFNRKILIDPFDRDGRPVYKEAWEILGYSKERMEKLAREIE